MLESIFEQDFISTRPEAGFHESVWGIELTTEQADSLLEHIPSELIFENRSRAALKEQREAPLLLFLSDSTWESLNEEERRVLFEMEASQVVLICQENNTCLRMSQLAALNFLIMRWPIDPFQAQQYIEKTRQSRVLYQDIFRMAQEISLERELMARKNEQLDFLNTVLTHASLSLEPEHILQQAADDLSMLLDVKTLFACFWEEKESGIVESEIYLPEHLALSAEEKWLEYLGYTAQKYVDEPITSYQTNRFCVPGKSFRFAPRPEDIVPLPMRVGKNAFGVLFVVSSMASKLGQDKILTLQSAANHLSLALNNALRFRRIKHKADQDGLTRISNRQHFNRRILEELKRHQRHKDELCLLLLDIDYFKKINDEYGHQAGDMVLREMSRVLVSVLRQSDFPARYGGEEFTVILPQTSEKQAWVLAERIRKKIAATSFRHGKISFRVTVSIGITAMSPGALVPPEILIESADRALYQAKTGGRNMVCCSAKEDCELENAK